MKANHTFTKQITWNSIYIINSGLVCRIIRKNISLNFQRQTNDKLGFENYSFLLLKIDYVIFRKWNAQIISAYLRPKSMQKKSFWGPNKTLWCQVRMEVQSKKIGIEIPQAWSHGYGILFRKLFWSMVRKIVLVIKKNWGH